MRRIHAVSVPVLGLVLAVLVGALSHASMVVAQDRTPPDGAIGSAYVPEAATCTIQPRDLDAVLDLWFPEEPGTAMSYGMARGELFAEFLPVGVPADEATIAGITVTLHGYFSCLAAGDMPRSLAWMSDDMVRQLGPAPFHNREEARASLEANPAPHPVAEPIRILAVTNVMVLQDGRVGAFVIDTGSAGTFTAYVIFEQQPDGTWLVDQVIEFA